MSFLSRRKAVRGRGATSRAGAYAHVGQRGAEVLVDVGLQNGVEVLELDVANQSDDENLEEKAGVSGAGRERRPGPRRACSPAR